MNRYRRGDRVFGLLAGGGYAELLVTDERLAIPIPDCLSFDAAATLPEVLVGQVPEHGARLPALVTQRGQLSEDVVEATGLPVLCSIPRVAGANGDADVVTLDQARSETAEALRILRMALLYTAQGGEAPRCLLVTSPEVAVRVFSSAAM